MDWSRSLAFAAVFATGCTGPPVGLAPDGGGVATARGGAAEGGAGGADRGGAGGEAALPPGGTGTSSDGGDGAGITRGGAAGGVTATQGGTAGLPDSGGAGAPSGGIAAAGGVAGASACPPGRAECDGSPDTLCETDLAASPRHCGRCNRSCGGGLCAAGRCEPDVIFEQSGWFGRGGVVLDAGGLYALVLGDSWLGNGDHPLLLSHVSLTGSVEPLDTEGSCPGLDGCREYLVATDDTEVFWASRIGTARTMLLRAVDKVTKQIRTVCTGDVYADWPIGLTSDATDIYFWSYGAALERCPKAGGTIEPVHTEAGLVDRLFYVDDALFWGGEDGTLARFGLLTEERLLVDVYPPGICAFAADATSLFWAECAWSYRVFRGSFSGVDEPAVVFQSSAPVAPTRALSIGDGSVAVDDDYVYALEYGHLWRVAKAGGPPEEVATTLLSSAPSTRFLDLAGTDASYIYLYARVPATIARVPKLP